MVNLEFPKHHSKSNRRTPAYSQALLHWYPMGASVWLPQKGPATFGYLPNTLFRTPERCWS